MAWRAGMDIAWRSRIRRGGWYYENAIIEKGDGIGIAVGGTSFSSFYRSVFSLHMLISVI